MKTSEQMNEFYKAFYTMKKELPKVEKDKVNPFFNSKYADINVILDAIRPILERHEFIEIQTLVGDGKIGIQTRLVHVPSGQWLETDGFNITPKSNDPQQAGSAMTYARRYDLVTLLGLIADEDDDANKSSGKTVNRNEMLKQIEELITKTGTDKVAFMKYYNVSDLKFMKNDKLPKAIKALKQKQGN